ncbi:hypothetical protein [Zooshikella ganghwensis]|nr:hypothetical protein [Zooshikella ganghwensis]
MLGSNYGPETPVVFTNSEGNEKNIVQRQLYTRSVITFAFANE